MTATLPAQEQPVDTWRTHDPEDLSGKFGKALVARARHRTVQPRAGQPFNQFTVLGEGRFSDAYPTYQITFDGRRYHCSCREHAGGEYRNMCSHALAVLMYRREHRSAAERNGPAPEPTPQPTETTTATAPLDIPSPRDAMFGDPPLPAWITSFRPHQWQAVTDIIDSYISGDRVVFLDAPTGAGKTLIAELVRRLLHIRALYVCSTKSLQAQFLADFPYAKVLMGRNNYPTGDHPDRFGQLDPWGNPTLTCGDCTKTHTDLPACESCPSDSGGDGMHCNWCHPWFNCPYERAKNAALTAPLAVLNTSYLLTEANAVGKFSARDPHDPTGFRPGTFGLVVVDEADLLESELMGQVEVRITKRHRSQLGIEPPAKKTVEASWVDWVAEECLPKVQAALRKLPAESADVKQLRQRQRLERLLSKVRVLADGLGDGNWVYGGYNEEEIVFRPIRVDGFGRHMLWRHAPRFLLMSATIIETQEMVESLGLDAAPTGAVAS